MKPLAAEVFGVPEDRILVETDAPYLAPGKTRGKRNEPASVVEVYRAVAKIRGIKVETLARRTRDNFRALFQPPAK